MITVQRDIKLLHSVLVDALIQKSALNIGVIYARIEEQTRNTEKISSELAWLGCEFQSGYSKISSFVHLKNVWDSAFSHLDRIAKSTITEQPHG